MTHPGGRSGGRWTALLNDLWCTALLSPHRLVFVTADEALAERIRERVGDVADVQHARQAPRGVVLVFPADPGPPSWPERVDLVSARDVLQQFLDRDRDRRDRERLRAWPRREPQRPVISVSSPWSMIAP